MPNPYPFELSVGGVVKESGDLTFTDSGNQPGGGSQPYAWIGADAAGTIVDPSGAPEEILWGSAFEEGASGFALNADTFTWDCTADGIYVIYIEPRWTLNTGNAPSQARVRTSFSASIADPNAPWNQIFGLNQDVLLADAVGTNAGIPNLCVPWSLPPMQFQSGDSFKFTCHTVDQVSVTADLASGTDILITPNG